MKYSTSSSTTDLQDARSGGHDFEEELVGRASSWKVKRCVGIKSRGISRGHSWPLRRFLEADQTTAVVSVVCPNLPTAGNHCYTFCEHVVGGMNVSKRFVEGEIEDDPPASGFIITDPSVNL